MRWPTTESDVWVATLTTADPQGRLHRRRLPLAGIDDDGRLWFHCLEALQDETGWMPHMRVNVSFCDPQDLVYVSISGYATRSPQPPDAVGTRRRAPSLRRSKTAASAMAAAWCVVPDAIDCWDGQLPGAGRAPQVSVTLDDKLLATLPPAARLATAWPAGLHV